MLYVLAEVHVINTDSVKKERNQYFPPHNLWTCCSIVTLSKWALQEEQSSNTWTHPDFGPGTAINHACPHLTLCFRLTVWKDFSTLFDYFLSAVQVYSTTGCIWWVGGEQKESMHIKSRELLFSLKCFYVYTILYGCSQSKLSCFLHWKWARSLNT